MGLMGRLISAFIYIGLFFGLAIFIMVSVVLVLGLAMLAVDMEDKIKRRKNDIRTVGICASRTEPADRVRG